MGNIFALATEYDLQRTGTELSTGFIIFMAGKKLVMICS
jgi:hypothetical protein